MVEFPDQFVDFGDAKILCMGIGFWMDFGFPEYMGGFTYQIEQGIQMMPTRHHNYWLRFSVESLRGYVSVCRFFSPRLPAQMNMLMRIPEGRRRIKKVSFLANFDSAYPDDLSTEVLVITRVTGFQQVSSHRTHPDLA